MRPALIILLTTVGLFVLSGQATAQGQLDEELTELESYLGDRDKLAKEVSAVGVAWHVDHALKVILSIYDEVQGSDPEAYRANFNFIRPFVFATGRMPRGVGKAPQSVLPPDEILTEDIREQLAMVRTVLPKFSGLDKKQHYNHYFFGVLNRRRALKFLKIHTRHHLRIIRDIIDAADKNSEAVMENDLTLTLVPGDG